MYCGFIEVYKTGTGKVLQNMMPIQIEWLNAFLRSNNFKLSTVAVFKIKLK